MPKVKPSTSRRGFLGALAVSGATLAASRAGAAPGKLDLATVKKDTDVACLYHLDFGDPQRFGQLITNMNNHLSVYEYDTMRVKLVVVAHGAGLKVFLDDLSGTPLGQRQDRSRSLQALHRPDQVRRRGVSLRDHLQSVRTSTWPRPRPIRS